MTKFSTRCLFLFLIFCILIILQYSFLHHLYETHFAPPTQPPQRKPYQKLPDALIIGVRKGGTRALLEALNVHDAVRIVHRETHFFDANYTLGTEWYRQQMPWIDEGENQIVVEKTPGYFTSKMAPKRVHQLDPNIKIILIVRHPVFRTISDFTQVYYNRLEQNKTLPILSVESFRIDKHSGAEHVNTDYKPILNSLYDVHIANWLNYFPLHQIHIVNGDVFRANPLNELRRLETFLGIPPRISASQLIFDTNKGFFCFRKRNDDRTRCLGESKGRKHRAVSMRTREKLAQFFAPHMSNFFQLINRTFNWDVL